MSEIRGILFDKDGTLSAFDEVWPAAYRAITGELAIAAGDPALAGRLLRAGGYDEAGVLDPASVLACGTTEAIVAFWAALPELACVADVAALIDRRFLEFARAAPPLVEDFGGLLDRLRARGMRLGIATNDSEAGAADWLAGLGLADRFDFVSGADSGHGAKPDPAVLHAFCGGVGLAPGEVAVVGDSERDIGLARNGGAGRMICVLTGVAGRADLEPHADCVIASIADLEAALEGAP
jgi:phosphoglycolate phosphatase